MQPTGNNILITGGGSGIGRGLAEALQKLGNHIIISGRRQQVLDETTRANPGIQSLVADVDDPAAIQIFAKKLLREFPALNAVILNAGIMKAEDLKGNYDLALSESILTTNLLGPIRLVGALLPHFLKQAHSTIVTVSSGLAFVPLAATPTYSATKAAIHSWSQSLRFQLRNTGVEVVEIIPPYVQTELMGAQQASDPNAMPLTDFIRESVTLLTTQPRQHEVNVERVYPLRFAEKNGNFDQVFQGLNNR